MSSTLLIIIPFGGVVAQVSCINCTNALYTNMNKDREKVPEENYSSLSMAHKAHAIGVANMAQLMQKSTWRKRLGDNCFSKKMEATVETTLLSP